MVLKVYLHNILNLDCLNELPSTERFAWWCERTVIKIINYLLLDCQQTFIAVGQAKVSLFLELLRKIILLIPLIYTLPIFFEDKVFAVFFAEPIADIVAVSITVIVFTNQFKNLLIENN